MVGCVNRGNRWLPDEDASQRNLSQSDPLGDGIRLIEDDFVFVVVEDVASKDFGEIFVHVGIDEVEFADEGMFDPISYRFPTDQHNEHLVELIVEKIKSDWVW